jgi:hypothetical protein
MQYPMDKQKLDPCKDDTAANAPMHMLHSWKVITPSADSVNKTPRHNHSMVCRVKYFAWSVSVLMESYDGVETPNIRLLSLLALLGPATSLMWFWSSADRCYYIWHDMFVLCEMENVCYPCCLWILLCRCDYSVARGPGRPCSFVFFVVGLVHLRTGVLLGKHGFDIGESYKLLHGTFWHRKGSLHTALADGGCSGTGLGDSIGGGEEEWDDNFGLSFTRHPWNQSIFYYMVWICWSIGSIECCDRERAFVFKNVCQFAERGHTREC